MALADCARQGSMRDATCLTESIDRLARARSGGTHRFYSAYRARRPVRCFVITCDAPLPSRPMKDWALVQMTTAKLSRALRYDNFTSANFRHIKAPLARDFAQRSERMIDAASANR